MPRYRVYDHRLKQAVFRSRNPNLFPELAIPRSTALGWIKRGDIRDSSDGKKIKRAQTLRARENQWYARRTQDVRA